MLAPNWSNFTRHLEGSLTSALGRYLDDWRNNATAASDAVDKALAEENFSNVLLYLMVMIGMLAFIIVAMLVSTVKSRRKEHSNDLYHQYIKDDWTAQIQQGDIFTNASARWGRWSVSCVEAIFRGSCPQVVFEWIIPTM